MGYILHEDGHFTKDGQHINKKKNKKKYKHLRKIKKTSKLKNRR